MMTMQTDDKTAQPEVAGSVVAHLDDDHSQPIQGRKVVLGSDNEPASVLGRGVDTWSETISGNPVEPRPWRGDEAAGTGSASGGDCLNETGAICPKFAEARAGRSLAERQVIELTHRLVNMLQVLSTRIERRRRMHDDLAVRDEFDRLLASLRASAQLHRYLLPPREFVHVDLSTFLGHMAAAIEVVTGLHCDVEVEPESVPGHVAMHLAAAVNELAWNAYKHAYHSAEGGVIRIVSRRDADARLLVSVADQGRGLPAGFDPSASNGLGLMVVYATARQFGGEVRIESDRGTRFTLLVPIQGVNGTPQEVS